MAGLLAVAVVSPVGARAAAAEPPAITDEALVQYRPTDATLEATIASGGAPSGAYYQFQVATETSNFAEELQCPPPPTSGPFLACIGPQSDSALPLGHIPHEESPTRITLDLESVGATLNPHTTYHFRVVAASAHESEDTIQWDEPTVFGSDESFTTPPIAVPVPPEPVPGSAYTPASGTPPNVLAPPMRLVCPDRKHRRHHKHHHRRHGHRRHCHHRGVVP